MGRFCFVSRCTVHCLGKPGRVRGGGNALSACFPALSLHAKPTPFVRSALAELDQCCFSHSHLGILSSVCCVLLVLLVRSFVGRLVLTRSEGAGQLSDSPCYHCTERHH